MKIIVTITLLFACLPSEAQKFLRYQMNSNTYNGFYTNGIGSILHDYKNGIATTYVHAFGKVYEIPINDIDCVSVEDAIITDGDIGQYRIYEFNYQEGDIRKIYVDNRATLFASHNGDFGANDTILFSSAYNDIAWVFYTDNQGRIKKFSDGNLLLFFDYDSDNEFTILDLSTNNTEHYQLNTENKERVSRALSFSQISTFFSNLVNNTGFRDFMVGVGLNGANMIAGNFAHNINDVGNNPELHNQSFIIDGLSIIGDIVGIGASLIGEVPSLGWSTAGVAVSAGSLLKDLAGLVDHIWPDSEQMQRYRDYYQNKYSIHVAAIAAENVSYTSATLRGEATSFEGLNGSFSFRLYGENDESLPGIKKNITSNSCIITANASKLKPGWPYFYSVQYTCVVDGLQLIYYADNIAEFMTLSPTAYTGEVQSKSSDRAEVICQFYNFPEGAICGVEYSCNDGKAEERANATHEGEYCFTLAQLKPNTTYTYQAFVIIDGIYFYADETKQFTTDSTVYQGCPDENHPHWIDLGLPSGTLWACCNLGASKPEAYGRYYTFGNIASAPSKSQIDELISSTASQWTEQNGVYGMIFTSANGGSIFFPAAGFYYWDDCLYCYDKFGYDGRYGYGHYWSKTPFVGYSEGIWGWMMEFTSDGVSNHDGYGLSPVSVRPVKN